MSSPAAPTVESSELITRVPDLKAIPCEPWRTPMPQLTLADHCCHVFFCWATMHHAACAISPRSIRLPHCLVESRPYWPPQWACSFPSHLPSSPVPLNSASHHSMTPEPQSRAPPPVTLIHWAFCVYKKSVPVPSFAMCHHSFVGKSSSRATSIPSPNLSCAMALWHP
jgi:hypothetical protein